ncbi:Lrp/AsnC family transcriptional regulator [Pseudonocardia sp. GCM10023141]|uniref:Lrp/AsnC family transcriptional regulator n=1 Tax=Pseudonocardia sp. GCM10023141 TaxID=3252653 RepID=UPI003621D5DB
MSRPPHDPDELDLALVNAVQLGPRASWTTIGRVLEVDAATALRRWTRLVEEGTAWLTADPGTPRGDRMWVAFVEVDCARGQVDAAAAVLALHPAIVSVQIVSGSCDLLLTVFIADLAALSTVLIEAIARVPGVLASRRYLATQIHRDGSRWQRGTLDAAQRHMLRDTTRTTATGPLLGDDELRALVHALAPDCRASISDLSALLGVSRATARRRLETALAHRQLVIRCDVSGVISGAPLAVVLRAAVPPDELVPIARAIAALPETRLAAGVTGGPSNLLLAFWVRDERGMQQVEATLAGRFPQLRVADRAVRLRDVKRIGRLFDDAEQATATTVLDPWAPGVEAAPPSPAPHPEEPTSRSSAGAPAGTTGASGATGASRS